MRSQQPHRSSFGATPRGGLMLNVPSTSSVWPLYRKSALLIANTATSLLTVRQLGAWRASPQTRLRPARENWMAALPSCNHRITSVRLRMATLVEGLAS
jgi:hypothetical protein